MKSDLHPFYMRKRVRDVVCAEGWEWTHTVKVTQFFLPCLDSAALTGFVKAVLVLLVAILFSTDKIKEAAPIIVSVMEQLH